MRQVLTAGFLALSSALTAGAQVHQIAYSLEDSPPPFGGQFTIDHSVAVSSKRVVVVTNNRLQIYSRAGGTPLDDWAVSDPNFALDPIGATLERVFFDPRVEYDPIHDRFWLVCPQETEETSYLHIAISKNNEPNGFDASDWHLFTGASGAFDFQDTAILTALQFSGWVDHPTFNVTGSHLYIVARDIEAAGSTPIGDVLVAFPLSHSGGSMLSGAKPSEGDLKILRLPDGSLVDPADDGIMHYLVQDPHQEDPGVQFVLCTPNSPTAAPGAFQYTGVQDGIRIGGAWIDSFGNLQYEWVDMPMPSSAFNYFNPEVSGYLTATPDSTWEISTLFSKFDSGVIGRSSNDDVRIFTAHNVLVAAGSPQAAVDRQELRWHVIDPDLGDFHTSWNPSIVVSGVAPAASGEETYHGNIAVNGVGAAYITFTRSGPSSWPSLYYSKLSSNYSTVLFTSQIEHGPAQRWLESSSPFPTVLSADYTDLQADPLGCGFWSVAALVDCNDCDNNPAPAYSNFRAIWLSEFEVSCNNAEMNGDGVVDSEDLAIFLDYYTKGATEADMDGDETVGALDYLVYNEEYAKR